MLVKDVKLTTTELILTSTCQFLSQAARPLETEPGSRKSTEQFMSHQTTNQFSKRGALEEFAKWLAIK